MDVPAPLVAPVKEAGHPARALALALAAIPITLVLCSGVVYLSVNSDSVVPAHNLMLTNAVWALACIAGVIEAIVAIRAARRSRATDRGAAALVVGITMLIIDIVITAIVVFMVARYTMFSDAYTMSG